MTKEEALKFIAQSIKSDVDMAKVADAIEALLGDEVKEEYDYVYIGNGTYEKRPKVKSEVSEVTALAEWTEKLTKASEDAYNKGYADGVKSVNICPHCGEYIGEEE